MAHRAHGIADLVGNAGAQSTQGGKLGLLYLFGQQAGVLQEHDDRSGAGASKGGEMCPDDTAAVERGIPMWLF